LQHVTFADVSCNQFVMGASVKLRVKKHREQLRASGLRPVQLWLPDTSLPSYRFKCERESASLHNDPNEAELESWIAEIAETEEWQ
jgi:hypothetical protein